MLGVRNTAMEKRRFFIVAHYEGVLMDTSTYRPDSLEDARLQAHELKARTGWAILIRDEEEQKEYSLDEDGNLFLMASPTRSKTK
jgi:hypothetical protein